MKYTGSKAQYINDIVPILQFEKQVLGTEYYYEPFVGGANIIQNVDFKYRLGSDLREDLINFYNYIKQHGIDWIPNSLPDKNTYFDIVHNRRTRCQSICTSVISNLVPLMVKIRADMVVGRTSSIQTI